MRINITIVSTNYHGEAGTKTRAVTTRVRLRSARHLTRSSVQTAVSSRNEANILLSEAGRVTLANSKRAECAPPNSTPALVPSSENRQALLRTDDRGTGAKRVLEKMYAKVVVLGSC